MTENEREAAQRKPDDAETSKTGGKPCDKRPKPADKVESSTAQLSARPSVKIEYRPQPPTRPLTETQQEPPRHIPLVPPGPFEPDEEESPPLDIDEPQTDSQPDPQPDDPDLPD